MIFDTNTYIFHVSIHSKYKNKIQILMTFLFIKGVTHYLWLKRPTIVCNHCVLAISILRGHKYSRAITLHLEKSWENFGNNSPILRKKLENFGKHTKFSRNFLAIFPSVGQIFIYVTVHENGEDD